MSQQPQDPDGIMGAIESSLEDEGSGYNLQELKNAHESLSGHVGDEKGFEEVEPIFIEVLPNTIAVREEEYEARSVIIEYDEYDQVVSVELL